MGICNSCRINKEGYIPGHPKALTIEQNEKIIEQMKKKYMYHWFSN